MRREEMRVDLDGGATGKQAAAEAPGRLKVTAIIPVKNAAAALERCLASLAESVPAPPSEYVVVLDGSTDDSLDVARRHGCRVIALPETHGPAYARNVGAMAASGDLLLFLDSDVCVHRDTLDGYRRRLESDPGAAAVFGAYDDEPASRNFLSQYRNLMNAYVHSTSRAEACTFWSACGMIRREVLLACGGFDENYARPCIEDIELGARLVRCGARIRLDAAIRSKHLKRWTFWGMLRTDIFDRGIPWTELILQQRTIPNDLNVRGNQRLSVVLSWLLVAGLSGASFDAGGSVLLGLAGLFLAALGGAWSETVPLRRGAVTGAALAAGFAAAAWLAGTPVPAALLACYYAALGVRAEARAKGGRLIRSLADLLAGSALVASAGASLWNLPPHPALLAAAVAAILLAAINVGFYRYIAARRGWVFGLAVMPLNFLYHFHNGLALAAGVLRFAASGNRQPRQALSTVIPAEGISHHS